jgi:hypothetical protein
MRFKILSQIGEHYQHEEGTEGVRRLALGGLEQRLKLAYTNSDKAKEFATTKQVATNLPAVGGGRVKALAAFHLKQQTKEVDADKANAEVIRIRQWLHRQNASLSPEGKIIWPKSTRTVMYDHDLRERNISKITARGGLLCTADGKPLDTRSMVTHFSGPGYAIYVMSREGNLHVSSHSVGHRHHSSLLAGGAVSGAGELKVNKGQLVWISNKSGHYCPDVFHLLQTLHSLYVQRVPLNFPIQFLSKTGVVNYQNMVEFVNAQGFDDFTVESMQILHGYGHYLTRQFLANNNLGWVPATNGTLFGGIYDLSVQPPRRVPYDEFARKMHAAGMPPKFVAALGVGR